MRLHALVILGVGWLVVALTMDAATTQDDVVKKELEKLQATWATTSIEADGEKVTEEERIKSRKLTIKGSGYTLKVGDETVQGTLVIDPGKKPKTIDVKPSSGLNKGKTLLGIYELEGGSLKTCIALPGKERPTKFSTESGTGHQLVVYKRGKP